MITSLLAPIEITVAKDESYLVGMVLCGMAIFYCFAACLVLQVIWDFLEGKFFNTYWGRLIKSLCVLAVIGVFAVIAFTNYFPIIDTAEGKVFERLPYFLRAFTIAISFVPAFSVGVYAVAMIYDWNRMIGPLIGIFAFALSAVLGLVFAFFPALKLFSTFIPVIFNGMVGVFIVIFTFENKALFIQ